MFRSCGVVWGAMTTACRIGFEPNGFDPCAAHAATADAVFRWRDNQHCYSWNRAPTDWRAAASACAEIGAHLATLTSLDENAAVSRALAPGVPTWIGLSTAMSTDWSWVTGEPALFAGWQAGEPALDPAAVVLEPDGSWRTTNELHGFLCESSLVITFDRVYAVDFAGASWDNARLACAGRGGHLATITSPEEQLLVGDLPAAWIGGFNATGSWEWVTGEGFGFASFITSQASAPGLCVRTTPAGWRSDTCSAARPHLCELE
jgi:Lectin C-type domain